MKTNYGQNERILDPHSNSRKLNFQAKVLCQKIKELVGDEQAQEIALNCTKQSIGEYGLDPETQVELLAQELGKLKLENIKNKSFSAYCTIKNIAHYSQLPYEAVNRQQTIYDLVSRAGYESLGAVKNEFPHLWSEK